MVSNRTKRNIWLTLLLMGLLSIVSRVIDVATGGKWWQLLSAIFITAMSYKAYSAYRKAVKEGNLFGPANPFGRQRHKDTDVS